MKTEASQAAQWLEIELEEIMSQEEVSVGNGSTSVATGGGNHGGEGHDNGSPAGKRAGPLSGKRGKACPELATEGQALLSVTPLHSKS